MYASRCDVRMHRIVQCTHICAESGRSSACRSNGLSCTNIGPSGIMCTIPCVSAIESAELDKAQEELWDSTDASNV